nr:protein FAR1-RELATED SEQUENCE 5-like [Quercus suber]
MKSRLFHLLLPVREELVELVRLTRECPVDWGVEQVQGRMALESVAERRLFAEEAQPIDGSPNTSIKHNKEIKAPMIGMKFDCDDNAYEFYKQYAHRMGFSVRKQYVRRGSVGHIKTRTFCCSKEGERAIDKRREQWLFETFLSAMSGKLPKTIFTDQSTAMDNAIKEVFPESNHRLCVWHIYQNAAKRLHHIFNSSNQFRNDFGNCVYDFEDKNEWIVAWNDMLETFDLTDNPWLCEMFDVKEKWCMVYGRHMFTADMKSTQRSESMNSVLKKYLKSKHGLLQFFGHYSRVLPDKRSQELQAEFKMRQTTPVLLFDFEMLRHAAKLYTPEIFKMFQDEYVKIVDFTIYKASKSDSITEYRVKYRNKTQEHLVKYEASTTIVQCSCMKFSFLGILCSHALKVLDKKNVKRIPAHYVLKRWTQDAKAGSIKDYRGIDVKGFARNENCSNLVGQDNVVGLNGLNEESFDCEFLVRQDHVGLYGLYQVLVDPDIDNL